MAACSTLNYPPPPQLFLKTALSLFSQPLRAFFSPSLFPAGHPRLICIYKQGELLRYKLVSNVSCPVTSRVDVELNVGLGWQDSNLETVKKKKG